MWRGLVDLRSVRDRGSRTWHQPADMPLKVPRLKRVLQVGVRGDREPLMLRDGLRLVLCVDYDDWDTRCVGVFADLSAPEQAFGEAGRHDDQVNG